MNSPELRRNLNFLGSLDWFTNFIKMGQRVHFHWSEFHQWSYPKIQVFGSQKILENWLNQFAPNLVCSFWINLGFCQWFLVGHCNSIPYLSLFYISVLVISFFFSFELETTTKYEKKNSFLTVSDKDQTVYNCTFSFKSWIILNNILKRGNQLK